MIYRLYPNAERVTIVPLGMGVSVYTLPDVPTIGFARDRTLSCTGTRTTSTTMGESSKFPMERLDEFTLVQVHRQTDPTNPRNSHQIRHTPKVVGREVRITSRLYFRESLVDLRPELLLAIAMFSQLPKSKGRLESF